MNPLPTPPRKLSQQLLGTTAQAVAHLSMVLLIAVLIAWAILPLPSLKMLLQYNTNVPDVRSMNTSSLLIQLGLAACIWTMTVIVYKLIALHRATPTVTRLRVARGTVLTETLIILPIFFLLTFGLAQLAINNMAGVLANVAVYEASRAVWIWQPEVDSGRFPDEDPADRARIAAAQVMTPVAPGNFRVATIGASNKLSPSFKASRKALIAAQIPFGGTASGLIPDTVTDVIAATLPGANSANLGFDKALDTQSFLVRSYTKYTHAYLATDVEIINDDGNLGAKLTYQHNQTMPMVGGIFGEKVGFAGLGGPGQRAGYYADYTREFTLPAQRWLPNKLVPQNAWSGGDEPEEVNQKCKMSQGANENSDSEQDYTDEC